ncbi:Zn2+ or Fe2+ permease [Hepatocystis sp. ex Piliocolobus tephrosceles]|nr:Zn2+ or Fe2+ permease [Hepatocystis sp. ex Piliocolobus tephrosceles]
MDKIKIKGICIFAFIIVATFGCAIPYLIETYGKINKYFNEKRINKILAIMNCFGSGFIFSIVLFHIVPETIMDFISHEELSVFNFTNNELKILFIFFFLFVGFSLQLILEYVLADERSMCCGVHENVNHVLDDNASNKSLDKCMANPTDIEINNTICNEKEYIHSYDVEEHLHKKNWVSNCLQVLTLQSFVLTVSLAVHSCIEGMVVGTSNDNYFPYITTICILAHKWIGGMTIALSLKNNHVSKGLKTFFFATFIFASPIGIIIGHLISEKGGTLTTGIINCISAGTLLFIGLEILLNEIKQKLSKTMRFVKWLTFTTSCLIAFTLIRLTIVHGHLGGHSHTVVK